MRITWISNHKEGLPAFKSVLKTENEVNAFITLSDLSFSKRSAGTREYKNICKRYDIPYFEVDTIKNDEAYKIVLDANPDLLVVLGWSEIVPEKILMIPTIGTIGTHAAMLPHNRGSAPINWALIRGEKSTGNTMMWLNPEVDSGAIIDQISFDITIYDTCDTLYNKVAKTNEKMLLKLLNTLKSGKKPFLGIENETNEELLPRRRPKDGLINWDSFGINIYNFVRALTEPYPGAFTYLNGKKIIVWDVSILPINSKAIDLKPGQILGNVYGIETKNNGIIVGTKTELLFISKISIDGKKYSGKKINSLNLKGFLKNE